jgi:hypothetical protein
MVIGYLFESILGFIFALGLSINGPMAAKQENAKLGAFWAKSTKIFFDCAIYFVVSIQISCVVVLVRKDFGISANGLGGLTVQITWAVALLCMLPLLYPLIILGYTDKDKRSYRFFLFCGCWILFFYTFISQMVGDFGPSQVGQGKGSGGTTIITNDEYAALTNLCLTGVQILSPAESKVLDAFGAAGSIIVTLYGLLYLLWFIAVRQFPNLPKGIDKRTELYMTKEKKQKFYAQSDKIALRTLIVLIPILAIPQFWGVFRLRNIQKSLAGATSNAYTDNQWTFGQVVAVTIFAPVFTEMGYSLIDNWQRTRGAAGLETSNKLHI